VPQPGAATAEELNLPGAGGLPLHTRRYRPSGDPRAVVLYVHGYAEHGGRFGHVAARLTAEGYAFQVFDQRHHGRSPGEPRTDLPGVMPVVEDVAAQVESARRLAPGRPLVIYGHSLGAFLSLATLVRRPDLADGLIACASPLDADRTVSPLLLKLADLLGVLLPRLPLVPIELRAISRDPSVVQAYESDPLVVRVPMRARLCSLLNAEARSLRPRLPELRLPLLVLHGEADRIAPVSGSRRLFETAGSSDKTLKIYPGLFHEVHNEPEREQVLADVVGWLRARFA